ncbi:kinase-like domain-containing protein [Rhizophagus irregularis DAOM 181602=DAOM 197198]|nr:kinase-like domain-containing protein [Rhizophagus irregularis DAOM 181602=DAOM 197198]
MVNAKIVSSLILVMIEWIEYDRFENVEYLAKGGFGTIYKAIWKDGSIRSWDSENNKWKRSKYWFREYENFPVVLKCLHNSQDITADFLREIGTHKMILKYIEPKNATDNKVDDNSFGEYSESIEAIDFTKLDLDKSN